MSTCVVYNKAATSRCGACSQYQAQVSWYCSKVCQQKHWKKHKAHCKLAQLYGRVRHLVFPVYMNNANPCASANIFNATWLEIGGIPQERGSMMITYLWRVPLASRPLLFGPGKPELKDDVLRAIDRVKLFNRTEYVTEYETRVSQQLRDKSKDRATAAQVPFDCRPYIDLMERGKRINGFEIFPSDYEFFDYYTFTKTVQLRSLFDPFKCGKNCKHRDHGMPIDLGKTLEKAEDFDWQVIDNFMKSAVQEEFETLEKKFAQDGA